MKEEWKVYIKGVPNRGDEVIKALTDLGAKNPFDHDGNTQKPFTPPSTSISDEELGGGEDLDGAKINYWY